MSRALPALPKRSHVADRLVQEAKAATSSPSPSPVPCSTSALQSDLDTSCSWAAADAHDPPTPDRQSAHTLSPLTVTDLASTQLSTTAGAHTPTHLPDPHVR